MYIGIYDINPEVITAVQSHPELKYIEKIECYNQSILKPKFDYDAIVAAGNSYGVMNGGLDLLYRNYFGQQVEDDLQNGIYLFYSKDGYIPVGESIIVPIIKTCEYEWMIYTPTMKIPSLITNLSLLTDAIKSAISIAKDNKLVDLAMPGLGTGTGGVSGKDFAECLWKAVKDDKWIN